MILVIDYNLKELKICAFREKQSLIPVSILTKEIKDFKDDQALEDCIASIIGKDKLEAISFRILFGGDYFAKPEIVDEKFFVRFAKLTGLFPFYIPLTLSMLKSFRKAFNHVPLVAFFETTFFLKLPDEKKYYTLPFKYHQDNRIKKFGFHGIFHEANSAVLPPENKIISIVFDKQTTVSAISKKRPFSVSLGYTPLEGIMSNTACGDIDPGIVFYLMNVHKFSIYQIDEMLKNKSGFLGLTGYDLELKDMIKLRGKDPRVDLAFDVYAGQIMKHIGEGISVLGGLDGIIIAGSYVDIFTSFIHSLIKKISFLGINLVPLPWVKDKNISCITSPGSKIKVYLNRLDFASIIFQDSEIFLRDKFF